MTSTPAQQGTTSQDIQAHALHLLDLTKKASTAYNRPDLTQRLNETRRHVADPTIRLMVVGEFKKGKSSLVNALTLAEVCPVDDDIATSVPTAIRHAETPTATVIYETSDPEEENERQSIPFEQAAGFVMETQRSAGSKRVRLVEIDLPSPLLQNGLTIIDTPGVGGLGSPNTSVTYGALPMADALLFVTDASQEFTKPELDFLHTAQEFCPNIFCALTKTDFFPEWRRIVELDKSHFERAELAFPIFPVSSALHRRAVQGDNLDLRTESGYPPLVEHIKTELIAKSQFVTLRSVVSDLISVTQMIHSQFKAEHEALADPDKSADLLSRLEGTKEKADELRSRLARWQQTLSDGIQDLTSHVEFDLRHRMRNLTRLTDDALDASDPDEVWEEFSAWLQQQTANQVVENYAQLTKGAIELARRVTEHFHDDQDNITDRLEIDAPSEALARISLGELDASIRKFGAGGKVMTGLRGSYGTMLMFGMLGTYVGQMAHLAIGMINPATVLLGVFSGKKAIKDEKKRLLLQRQHQAKTTAHRYVDDVVFQVSSDSRAALRQVQRTLRNEYQQRADELQKSAQEAYVTAQNARKKNQNECQHRLKEVEAELKRINTLREMILHFAKRLGVKGA